MPSQTFRRIVLAKTTASFVSQHGPQFCPVTYALYRSLNKLQCTLTLLAKFYFGLLFSNLVSILRHRRPLRFAKTIARLQPHWDCCCCVGRRWSPVLCVYKDCLFCSVDCDHATRLCPDCLMFCPALLRMRFPRQPLRVFVWNHDIERVTEETSVVGFRKQKWMLDFNKKKTVDRRLCWVRILKGFGICQGRAGFRQVVNIRIDDSGSARFLSMMMLNVVHHVIDKQRNVFQANCHNDRYRFVSGSCSSLSMLQWKQRDQGEIVTTTYTGRNQL